MRARVVAAATLLALLEPVDARGEPVNLHMRSPATCKTDGGSDLRLPPGYFMDEPTRDKLDAEVRRLQVAETRLGAENASLRASAAGWQPGWYTIAIVAASSLALGAYVAGKL